MEEELKRVTLLLEPEYTNTVNSLKDNEKQYFIEHIALTIQRGLKEWQFKNKKQSIN